MLLVSSSTHCADRDTEEQTGQEVAGGHAELGLELSYACSPEPVFCQALWEAETQGIMVLPTSPAGLYCGK